MASEVLHDPGMHRYELLVDGAQAGAADYRLAEGEIVFIHTEIDPGLRGHGLGRELARGALNLVRAESDHRVRALCPFMGRFLEEHPEYQELTRR